MVDSTGRTAFVVLFVLNGSYSIFSAPTKEWKMPERTVVPESWNQMVGVDDIALSAEKDRELAGLEEVAPAPSGAEDPIGAKIQGVTRRSVGEMPEAKPSVQDDDGWRWNGWKIAALVLFVFGIIGVLIRMFKGWHTMFGFGYVTIALFMASGLLFLLGCVPYAGMIFAGVGGVYFLAWMILIVGGITGGKKIRKE